DIAEEARALFVAATDEAKKQKAARPVKPPPVAQPIAQPKVAPGEIVIPFDDVPQPKPARTPAPVPVTQTVPPQPQPAQAEVKKPEIQPETASKDFVN